MEPLALELQRFNPYEHLEDQMELAEMDMASLILEARVKMGTLHWMLQLTRRKSEVVSCDFTWDRSAPVKLGRTMTTCVVTSSSSKLKMPARINLHA
jgi:hypothetical protein